MAQAIPGTAARRTAISRAIGAVSTLCGWCAAAMILAGVCITCQMIFVRFVLNQSTIWQTEAVTYLVIGATLLGLPYVQKQRGHVNVDLIPGLLPPVLRRGLAALVSVAGMAVVGVMLWYGWEMFHIAWVRGWTSDTVWGPQLWIPYLALPIGFGLLLLQLIADLIDALAGKDV